MKGEKLSLTEVANMGSTYWSDCSYSRKGKDGVNGGSLAC